MRALVIAQGNPLRRDDGVAHRVLESLKPACDVESRAVMQLTPEVAGDIAPYDTVIFIDADVCVGTLSIEPLDHSDSDPAVSPPALTHVTNAAEIVRLSRTLFGFGGSAFLCRIPVDDLSLGEGLSSRATALAAEASGKLEAVLSELRSELVSRRP
jgi:hydrogenase maturation protease